MADPQEGRGKGPDFKVSAPFEFSLETLGNKTSWRLILGLFRLSLLKLHGKQSQRRNKKRENKDSQIPLHLNKGLLVPSMRLSL